MSDYAHDDPAARRLRRATTVGVWIAFLLLIGLVLYLDRSDVAPREAVPGDRPTSDGGSHERPAAKPNSEFGIRNSDEDTAQVIPRSQAQDETESASSMRIENVTIRDRDGRVEFRGTVDIGPTLARIERGERLRFPNDGSTFSNRERRLPHEPSGYYREYVHPTPGDSGPGPQRVIVGRQGEVYYTFDHYRTFRRIK